MMKKRIKAEVVEIFSQTNSWMLFGFSSYFISAFLEFNLSTLIFFIFLNLSLCHHSVLRQHAFNLFFFCCQSFPLVYFLKKQKQNFDNEKFEFIALQKSKPMRLKY